MHAQLPVQLTFTGLDEQTPLAALRELSNRYPIEWGILLHPARQGSGRFPPLDVVRAALDLGLKCSAHLCGGHARDIVHQAELPVDIVALLGRFQRLQINTAERGVDPDRIAKFAARFGARAILQCRGTERFPLCQSVEWLFDASGGKGRLASRLPVPSGVARIVGYSGGLGPDTVASALESITRQHPAKVAFWIDMETGVRTEDWFDVELCKQVCEIVFDGAE
jgi:hypothetical protein